MITVHCVDISGSMSLDQLETAHREVLKRFKPQDIVMLFSVKCFQVFDLERPFTSYNIDVDSGGGTDAHDVLKFVQTCNAKSILYSDGYLLQSEISQFDDFLKIP